MISRVAENCFWMMRYVERADCSARLLRVNREFVLDVAVTERWRPVIVVVGEEKRFLDLYGAESANDDERAQEYLVWDEQNPVSLRSSLQWARENARTIRDVISEDMWQCINGFWRWFVDGEGRALYDSDRAEFYDRVKGFSASYQGLGLTTMLYEDPFDFMRLGVLLERAGQTARTLDVKHHMLGPTRSGTAESPLEIAEWTALLHSCSATEAFVKRGHGAPDGLRVAEFLVLEPRFPRSVRFCVERAWKVMQRLRSGLPPTVGKTSAAALLALVESVRATSLAELLALGIHEELTRIIDALGRVGSGVNGDYFSPSLQAQSATTLSFAPELAES